MAIFSTGKPFGIFVLGFATLLFAGCHSNQQATGADNGSSAATPADQSQQAAQDEASGNLVPVADTSGTADTSSASTSSASDSGSAALTPADDTADETAYGVQPAYTAPQPPPALPEYQQPPCPEDGDIWTPGYWSWAPTGYYWVPGAWVQAPYQGALWTPGYWGYSHARYVFFRGYWGPHIGFYGGINYGFGYVGLGYQGGYWNSGHFFYNRSVTNVNVTVIHNVYNRTVINNYTVINRVSFNGGSGGIQVRPRLAELAALREPHAPPMQTQIEIERSASQNRAQFAEVNHGRPAAFVETRAVVADRDVHPAVFSNLRNVPAAARPAMEANRGAEPGNRVEPNRAEPARPEAARPAQESRPEPNRPEARPEPQRVEPQRAEPQRVEPQRAEPQRRPEEAHPAPAQHPAPAEHRPAPERKPAPEHKEPQP
jgi:hypothetical protein